MFAAVDTLENDLRHFAQRGYTVPLPFYLTSSDVGKAIIQLAGGKIPRDLGHLATDERKPAPDIQEAATRFVTDVMLGPASNHFTTLGLSKDADSGVLRDNFRRLMALVHPDAHPIGYPADAASRVNKAYAVLADVDSRSAYMMQEFGRTSLASQPSVLQGHHRSNAAKERPHHRGPIGSRLRVLAHALRARHSLLWLAAILLIPLGMGLVSLFSHETPARLVEIRPQNAPRVARDSSNAITPRSTDTSASATLSSETLATDADASENSTSRAVRVANSKEVSERVALRSGANPTQQRQPASVMTSQLSPRSLEISSRGPVAVSLAPTPSQDRAAVATALQPAQRAESPTEIVAAASRSPEPSSPPTPRYAPANSAASATAARPLSPDVSESATRIKASDAEEVLVRFSNAYESGSIGAFGQLLASGMSGRRQMISDYDRVFSATRQRSIKFNQLKHAANGDRVATSGYATVTTTDHENRTVTQRVFLEFEIGRERGEPRIERLANYVIN